MRVRKYQGPSTKRPQNFAEHVGVEISLHGTEFREKTPQNPLKAPTMPLKALLMVNVIILIIIKRV